MHSQAANMIDLEKVLAAISPDAPSGEADLSYDSAFLDLEIKIKGTVEHEFDGKEVQETKKDPNWNEIQEAALALLSRSHDLRVAMFLIRALIHTQGFSGLRFGVEMVLGFVDRFWETLYPQLDPEDNNDPTMRMSILESLSKDDDIIGPLKRGFLCVSPTMGQFSYRDILIANGKIEVPEKEKASAPNLARIEAAFKDTKATELAATKAAISASSKYLKDLKSALAKEIGESAGLPDFSDLQKALFEMEEILEKQLEGRQISEQVDMEEVAQTSESADKQPDSHLAESKNEPLETINGRQDVVRLLDRICSYYQSSEPGSPVPLLLKRARQLVDKDFLEIIQDLAPDSTAKIKNILSGEGEEKS